jgi:hypothetical protein
MLRSRLLHNFLGMAPTCKDRLCQAAQQRHRVRLMLELLEDRITPSQILYPYVPLNTQDPRPAVANALASEAASNDYLIQTIDSYIAITGVLAGSPNPGNGSGQSTLNNALAALAQNLEAIGMELLATNFQNNPMGLLQLGLQQQQLQLTAQSQVAQQAPPSFAGIASQSIG